MFKLHGTGTLFSPCIYSFVSKFGLVDKKYFECACGDFRKTPFTDDVAFMGGERGRSIQNI